jgi:hypothetical protein
MAQYEAVTSVYETINVGTKRETTRLRPPGSLVEVPDEDTDRLLELGAVRKPGSDQPVEGAGSEVAEEVELPERPSNGASKDVWRAYLVELNNATRDELGELDVPADATRDQMIALGDTRIAEWNEG